MKKFLPLLLTAIFFQAQAEDFKPAKAQIGVRSQCSTEKVSYFDLKNEDSTPREYKVEIFKWTQYGLHPTKDLYPNVPVVKVDPNGTFPLNIIANVPQTDIQQTYKAQFTYINKDGKQTKLLAPIFYQPKTARKVDIQVSELGKVANIKNNGNTTLIVDSKPEPTYILPQSPIGLVVADSNLLELIQTTAKQFKPDEVFDCQ